jgi:hypothetical protein
LKKRQIFSKAHIHVVNKAVALAEELVSGYYKMSASEWLRPKFDVKTHVDLSSDEIVPGPFAQVVRYEGRLKDASLGSSSYDYYKICLQDHEILEAIAQYKQLELLPFTLYILTHELIHIVRFSRFLQNFNAIPKERMAEESRVHELTSEILRPVRIDGLLDVLNFYNQWREPIEGLDP